MQLLLEELAQLRAEMSSVKKVIQHFIGRGSWLGRTWRGWRVGCGHPPQPTSGPWPGPWTHVLFLGPRGSRQQQRALQLCAQGPLASAGTSSHAELPADVFLFSVCLWRSLQLQELQEVKQMALEVWVETSDWALQSSGMDTSSPVSLPRARL